MAWRIDESVVRGEIDNREQGRVTGRIWLLGREDPVELNLKGNPWRDLAGHLVRFTHDRPQPGKLEGFFTDQGGVVGDITASRKVRVPEIPVAEMYARAKAGEPYPWHWSNSLYLEWFSLRNGRVVIESTDYRIEIDPEPAWTMDQAGEREQRAENSRSLARFMEILGHAVAGNDLAEVGGFEEFEALIGDDDEPRSKAEAKADADAAYMDKLLDRIEARIEREGLDEDNFERIHEEERTRLRKEMGFPPDPEPTPEQLEEQQRWIDEMNAAAQEALEEAEADDWKGDPFERERPELVERATDLGVQLHAEIDALLPENPPREHPLIEIVNGMHLASAKIAGALASMDDEGWPPDPLCAGDSLVRLKKARGALRDALRGLDSAEEENLGTTEWRTDARREIAEILGEVQQLIAEVRQVLADEDD
jgi:hypothetical protein